MTTRLDYWTLAPTATAALRDASFATHTAGLPAALLHLVSLRASQINGCAYCVDLHYRDALKAGVDPRRINAVAAWRETLFFDERERAALAWTESLTRLSERGALDAPYEEVAARFSNEELAHLTFAIAIINAWNRMGVGFGVQPAD